MLLIEIFLQSKSKLVLICWCPDGAPIKKKMLYSSNFNKIRRAFVGVHKVKLLPNWEKGSAGLIKTFLIR